MFRPEVKEGRLSVIREEERGVEVWMREGSGDKMDDQFLEICE
jgi:hypothetical protein